MNLRQGITSKTPRDGLLFFFALCRYGEDCCEYGDGLPYLVCGL